MDGSESPLSAKNQTRCSARAANALHHWVVRDCLVPKLIFKNFMLKLLIGQSVEKAVLFRTDASGEIQTEWWGRHPPWRQIYPIQRLDDKWRAQNPVSNGNNLYYGLKRIRTFEQILSNQLLITISIFATKIIFLVFWDRIYVVQAGTEFQIFLC